MAHNFSLGANIYVSKAGNDANAGTDPNFPKLTIQSAITAMTNGTVIVVGTGYYFGAISWGTKFGTLRADGMVVIDCNGGAFSAAYSGGASTLILDGLMITNCSGSGVTASTVGTVNFTRCFFNCAVTGQVQNRTITNCVFIGNTISANGSVSLSFTNNTFINTTITTTSIPTVFKDNICDSGTTINSNSTITGANYNYNCIQGGIRNTVASAATSGVITDVAGNYYDLSIAGTGGTGTLLNPFQRGNTANAVFYLAAHKTAYSSFNVNSFSTDPLFNHASAGNYTISLNSPCFKTSSVAGVNIGALEAAFVQKSGVDIAGTFTNITGTTDLTISGGTTGTVEQDWVAFSPSQLKTLGVFRYSGALTFDKSVVPPVARNRNVPDARVYSIGDVSGGDNPDRLVFELAWYTGSGTPTTLADADNGGYAPTGTYTKFRWGLDPSFDAFGVPNGEPNWNSAVSQIYIACTYFKPKHVLTDSYIN